MTAGRRWVIVGLGVLLLVTAPFLVRALPASDSDLSAIALLHRVQHSRTVAYSGDTESAGDVGLPANNALSGLSGLLGGTNRVRVWWQGSSVWRTATLRPTGETDLVHTPGHTMRWVYESKNATMYPDVGVRLPTAVDLLPTELARRVLAGAHPSELRRIPPRRVAGRDALGLRLTPSDPQAAVGRVDVWVDRATGVPLRVEVTARGQDRPVLVSRFLDITVGRPAHSDLAFLPPADAHLHFDTVVDLAAAVDRFASREPPATLAGLPERRVRGTPGAVGVYGRGPTVLLALPLWQRTGDRVRHDLTGQPGVRTTDRGLLVDAAPLHLLLSRPEPGGTSWLLAGTVTQQALARAARQLAAHPPGLRVP
jgi:outer membrane lipoprotein-sorting protein